MKEFRLIGLIYFAGITITYSQKIHVEAQVISLNPNSFYGAEANNQWMITHSINGGPSKCDMVVFTTSQANGNTWRDLNQEKVDVSQEIDPSTSFNHEFTTWEHDTGDECTFDAFRCISYMP